MRIFFFGAIILAVSAAIVLSAAPPVVDQTLYEKLDCLSFSIHAGDNVGSGVMVTRKRGKDNVHFVWTAAHVLAPAQVVRKVIDFKKGVYKYELFYKDVMVVQEKYEDGRAVSRTGYMGRIVRYSDATYGKDLALIQLYKKNITTDSVVFYKGDLLKIGVSITNIGTVLGRANNTFSEGIIARVGKVNSKRQIQDQASLFADFGSSGSGIFHKRSGNCLGILQDKLDGTSGIIWYIPSREIKKWAQKTDCLWAYDNSKLPSDKEILSREINDVAIEPPVEKMTLTPKP